MSDEPIHRYAAYANIDAILKELRDERELVNQAIITMERYVACKSQQPAVHGKVAAVARQAAAESAEGRERGAAATSVGARSGKARRKAE